MIIVTFQIEGRDIPIVHRVLKLHEKEDGSIKALTKGELFSFGYCTQLPSWVCYSKENLNL